MAEYGEPVGPEVDALSRIIALSFHIPRSWWPTLEARVDAVRVLRGPEGVTGGLVWYDLAHWLGGKPVPSAGLAVVATDPTARGQGTGRTLLARTLAELHAEGRPLSSLYPSTTAFYRGVGFEHAGHRMRVAVELQRVGLSARPLPTFAVDPTDVARMAPLYEHVARGSSGMLRRSAGLWARLADTSRGDVWGFGAGTPDAPEGYVLFTEVDTPPLGYELQLRDFVATTPEAARTLWALLRDHRSMSAIAELSVSPNDPLLTLLPEQAKAVRWWMRWMVRIVSLHAAFTARGYAPGVRGELHLDVSDALLPGNEGRWIVEIADGAAQVRPGGRGELRVDIGGLAALYTGFHTVTDLRRLGLADAEPAAAAFADLAFAGPAPWMPDMF